MFVLKRRSMECFFFFKALIFFTNMEPGAPQGSVVGRR